METQERTKASKLCWKSSTIRHKDGVPWRIEVTVSLHDDCKNGHHDFSMTYDVYWKGKNNRWVWSQGGACGDEYCHLFPGLAKFNNLHLCNFEGQPSYPVKNTMYFIKQGEKETAMRYARLTEQEYDALTMPAKFGDEVYFKYMLFKLGIATRWKAEALEFIHWLEEKTNTTWVNPYATPKVMRPLTDEEMKYLLSQDWTEDALESKVAKKEQDAYEKMLKEFEDDFIERNRKIMKEYEIKKYLLMKFRKKVNAIYYDHTKTVTFNWTRTEKLFTQEEFDSVMADPNKPKDVTYEYRTEPKY